MTVAVLNAMLIPLLGERLPDWLDVRWYSSKAEALELAPLAEIGWFDMHAKEDMVAAVTAATRLKWLNSIIAGLDFLPADLLIERGVTVTNGAGINALTIAEYVVMGMLSRAKGYREVVRAQDRREWLREAPGKRELAGTKALILGYGAIGQLVDARLTAFGVAVTKVRRNAGPDTLGPDDWRARLHEFDWVILAVPATAETDGMIGAAELAVMKPGAELVNVARGAVVDQDALVDALRAGHLGGAFLDVTTPEPLPADHPLWGFDNVEITMHLSGRSQDRMMARGAERFLHNLTHWHAGLPLEYCFDPALGY
ncbi:D-2-hydroxyacid dehydrogenase [Novosphingobium sp.]|uniref:D-2-hydroxyacid dehydrogenase n=1 Tax=Novosphingobium sp. TaxID=1874826 RepID=UPI002736DFEA|nr:D-2-hydroxyacid dehydrogenase [Novosphingobium sp.]MDP3906876.1 D-2-hydroxyacid dehydrogenase [Novosphingobium sp.]